MNNGHPATSVLDLFKLNLYPEHPSKRNDGDKIDVKEATSLRPNKTTASPILYMTSLAPALGYRKVEEHQRYATNKVLDKVRKQNVLTELLRQIS